MDFLSAIEEFNKWRALKVRRIDGYDLDLRQFCIFLKNPDIEDITDSQIIEWLHLYKCMKFRQGTIIKKEEALRKFFEYYKKKGFSVVDPWLIPLSPKERVLPRVASNEEHQALLKTIPKKSKYYYHIRSRCMLSLLWNCGMRISELTNLDLESVDLKNKTVTIKTAKSRGLVPFRQLPLWPETCIELKKWLKKRNELLNGIEENALFIGITGGLKKSGPPKRLASSAAGEVFRKLSNKAGLGYYVNAHSYRHHMGTNLAMNNVDNSVISQKLGHSSVASSYQYTTLNNVNLVSTLRRIERRKKFEKVKK